MKYTVTAQIEVDGITYACGSSVELTEMQAASVSGCVVPGAAPVVPAKPVALAAAAAPKAST